MQKINKIVNFCQGNKKYFLLLTCFFSINLFIIYFISKERFFYYWDFRAYWLQWQLISDLFRKDLVEALKVLIYSIRNEEYNLLSGFFLMPFNFLFGNERLFYILAITNIYALPSAISSAFLVKRIAAPYDNKSIFAISFITILTVILFPHFWSPVLHAFPTVGGVLIINLVILLYIKKPVEEQKLLNLVLIGFLLSFVIMFKRWYAFWVVAFFISLAIERIVFLFLKYKFRIKNYLPAARNIFLIGIISLISFFLIATPIAKKMLVTDYADIYSAYKNKCSSDSFIDILRNTYNYFGLFFSSLFFLGFIQGILDRQKRQLFIFLFLQIIITFFIFARSYPFSTHNYYILIPTIVIFISYFIIKIFLGLKNKIFQLIFLIAYMLILLINFTVVFVPKVYDYKGKIAFLLPSYRHFPLIRNDIDEINNLLNVLDRLLKKEKVYIYVLSSSSVLNDDLLVEACLSGKEKYNFCNYILYANHVDKRDGFPSQFLKARYVVVADPIQYHLRPEDQRVIGLPAEQIINRKGIGLLYKQLSYHFYLDPSINVYIYEKIKPFKKADLDNLSQLFINYYPGWF